MVAFSVAPFFSILLAVKDQVLEKHLSFELAVAGEMV